MANSAKKISAIALRRQGESVKDISVKLQVPKSTVSFWVRDIALTEAQRKRLFRKMVLAGHTGRLKGALVNKEKRLRRIEYWNGDAHKNMHLLTPKELFFLGLGLYWGEGVKADKSPMGITNSDYRIILIAMRWFEEFLGISRGNFRPQIFISDTHRDRERLLLAYWSKTLNLPKSQFTKVIFLPRNKKIYENRNMYYGVLALRVLKGTDSKYRILGLIQRAFEVVVKPV
ncbi:hypothetical protein EPO14_00490 [Patescibacteria group bacterium]|nr:MAG: hypothetical protein EPO14_00490 [Patescibacteria group bacterium]